MQMDGTIYGYARVSTDTQDLTNQVAQLKGATLQRRNRRARLVGIRLNYDGPADALWRAAARLTNDPQTTTSTPNPSSPPTVQSSEPSSSLGYKMAQTIAMTEMRQRYLLSARNARDTFSGS